MHALMGMKHFFLLVSNFIIVESQCLYLEGIFAIAEDGALFLSVGTREPGGLPSMGSHRVRHD